MRTGLGRGGDSQVGVRDIGEVKKVRTVSNVRGTSSR